MKVSSVKGEWKINIQFWYKRKVKEKRNRTIFSNFFPIFWEIPFIWTKFKWKMHRNISLGGSQKCSILQVQLTWVSSFKKLKFDLKLFAFKGFKNMTQFSFSLFFLTICFISSFSIETHPRKRRHHKSMLSSMCLTNVPQIELKKTCLKKMSSSDFGIILLITEDQIPKSVKVNDKVLFPKFVLFVICSSYVSENGKKPQFQSKNSKNPNGDDMSKLHRELPASWNAALP